VIIRFRLSPGLIFSGNVGCVIRFIGSEFYQIRDEGILMFHRIVYITICLLSFTAHLHAFDTSMKYKNERLDFNTLEDQIYIRFQNPVSLESEADIAVREILGIASFQIQPMDLNMRRVITLDRKYSEDEISRFIESLNGDQRIAVAAPVFAYRRTHFAVSDEFIVRFHEGTAIEEIAAQNASNQAEILKLIAENTYLLRIQKQSRLNGLDAANLYAALPMVRWAQPNFIYLYGEILDGSANDTYWSQQWAHRNNGQSVATKGLSGYPSTANGRNDADMDVDLAWDALVEAGKTAGGSADIIVAILDSGIDLEHPDLQDNLLNDGIDFTVDHKPNADDDWGHGTAVAGVIAATGNNGEGVAGIAYNVKLLPLRIINSYGNVEADKVAAAVDTAWESGADVLSNSYSSDLPDQAVEDAIHRAKTMGRNGKGCLIFYSSGNDGEGIVQFPAWLTDVMGVGASTMFDEKKNTGGSDQLRTWGANYGTELDIVAPTTVYTTDELGPKGSDFSVDGDYNPTFSGTSAACPNAAGVGALILSADPNLTADEVYSIIQESADRIDVYSFNEAGWNEQVGYGRINANSAVRTALGYDASAPVIAPEKLGSTSEVGARTLTAVISDNSGIAAGSNQPRLYYRRIFQGDTSDWQSVTDADGAVGNTFNFIIPATSWGTQVQYYLAAQDNSTNSNMTTFPFGGSGTNPPGEIPPSEFLTYFIGDFATQTYASANVPLSVPKNNILYSSTLSIPDHHFIVDLNARLSISGHIEDYFVTLEAPSNVRSTGLLGQNGVVGSSYLNTVLDDEAITRITDGTSPYSGTFRPDNTLSKFKGLDAAGSWKMLVWDDFWVNNGGSLDNWSLEITYMNPVVLPVVTDIGDQTVAEGATFASIDLDDYVSDGDNTDDQISWSASGNNSLQVVIDPVTHVATISAPNADWYGSESITFTASDPVLLTDSDPATFTITPVNDAPVLSDIPGQQIAEGSLFVSINLDNFAADVDNTDEQLTWVYSGNTQLSVSINSSHVATISAPNADWNGVETISFKVADPAGLFDEDAAVFSVTAVNDAPVINPIPNQTIAEGGTFSVIALDNYVSDMDNSDAQMVWTYSGNIHLTVSISAERVAIISVPNADWNGSENIIFKVTDQGSLSDSDTCAFVVTAVNDAPQVIDIPDQTIAEGASFTTIALDNYVNDVDNNDSQIAWTFSGNSTLQVSINQNRIATISLPDPDWNGVETITFKATDPGNLNDTDPAVFTVTAVNDAPVVSPVPQQTVDEGATFGAIALDEYVSDVDHTDAQLAWTYSGNSQLQVSINASRIASVSIPNSEWNGSETITFKAADPAGLSDDEAVVFTVNAVNDAPVVQNIPPQSIGEGGSFSTIALDNFVADIDNPDEQLDWTYSGNFNLNVVINSSRIASISLADQDWSGSEIITFTATDPAGLSDHDTVKFTVTNVNDPPEITSTPKTAATQGYLYQYQVTVDDPDAGDEHKFSLTVHPDFLTINENTGLISGTPGPNDVGIHAVSVIVEDNSGLSDQQDYQLTVLNQNDPPLISPIPDQSISEGESFASITLDNYVSDMDEGDAGLVWSFAGNVDLQVSINPNRIATVSAPSVEWSGAENIIFVVEDSGGLNDQDTVLFAISSSNDAPVLNTPLPSISFAEDDSVYYAVANWYAYVSDPDNSDEELSYLVSNTIGNVKAIKYPQSYLFKSGEDWFGTDTLQLRISDGAEADSGEFVVHVLARNDAPRIVNIPDSIIFLDTQTAELNLSDKKEDADSPLSSLLWSISDNNTGLISQLNDQTEQLMLSSDGFTGVAWVYLQLSDDSNAVALDTIPVHVKKIPDALEKSDLNLPATHLLFQNYPNPFNAKTRMRFGLAQQARVRLGIYSMNGQLIKVLLQGSLPAGYHASEFDAGQLASGVYICRLEIKDSAGRQFVLSRKMILIK